MKQPIFEFEGNHVPVDVLRADKQIENVAVTVSSTASAAIAARTGETESIVRLLASVDTYIAIGAAPIADNTGVMIPARHTVFAAVPDGEKIAALRVGAADGVLGITRGG